MAACVALMYFLPASTLATLITKLPVLGEVPIVGIILMAAGISWALMNINSLPMVVDMTESSRIGTYTGLYYLFSTLAAILGPSCTDLLFNLAATSSSGHAGRPLS